VRANGILLAALVGVLALVPLVSGCTAAEDDVEASLDLATTFDLCDRCGLFRSSSHECGKTAYCTGCYGKAVGENRGYLAEGKFKVDPPTKLAKCVVCEQIVGQLKDH